MKKKSLMIIYHQGLTFLSPQSGTNRSVELQQPTDYIRESHSQLLYQ
jgi:hypothetical protein